MTACRLSRLDSRLPVAASPIQDTQLIRLTVKDTGADRVALIANCIAETFIDRIEALRQAGEQGNVKVRMAETARVPDKPKQANQ